MKRKRRLFAVSDSSSTLAFIEAEDKQGVRVRYERATGIPIRPQCTIREVRWRPRSRVPRYIYAGDEFIQGPSYICNGYPNIDWAAECEPYEE